MDRACIYEIRIEGQLAEHWSGWFEGLAICPDPDGNTALTGQITDQSALFGILRRIHDLNLVLISVVRLPPAGSPDGQGR